MRVGIDIVAISRFQKMFFQEDTIGVSLPGDPLADARDDANTETMRSWSPLEGEKVVRSTKRGEKNLFLTKHFTPAEIEYVKVRKNPAESLAGIFAAKEAFLKAINVGVLNGIKLSEIEVTHNKSGAPELKISSAIKKQYNITNAQISISHDMVANTAIAICILA